MAITLRRALLSVIDQRDLAKLALVARARGQSIRLAAGETLSCAIDAEYRLVQKRREISRRHAK